MSKKIMKRSLALGALMAFVITGSAMAASINETIDSGNFNSYQFNGVYENVYLTNNGGGLFSGKDVTIQASNEIKLTANNAHAIYSGNVDLSAPNIEIKTYGTSDGFYFVGNNSEGNIYGFDSLKIHTEGFSYPSIMSQNGAPININGNEKSNVTLQADNSYGILVYTDGDVEINTGTLNVTSKSDHTGVYPICVYGGKLVLDVTNIYVQQENKKSFADFGLEYNDTIKSGGEAEVTISGEAVIPVISVCEEGKFDFNIKGKTASFKGSIKGESSSNIKIDLGGTWQLTGESDLTDATFDAGSELVIDGKTFEYKKDGENVYALNGVGKNTKLTIVEGANIKVEGVDYKKYNVATGFENVEAAKTYWNVSNLNNLMQGEWIGNAKDGLQLSVTAKETGEISDDLGVDDGTASALGAIISGANSSEAPQTEAAQNVIKFVEEIAAATPENKGAAADAAEAVIKMAEAGGQSATAAKVVTNVTGVTNQRMSFSGAPNSQKGGHGVGLIEEGSGAAIWAQYVHGKDTVEDMPSTAGASSYTGQHNGIVMGVDFKKVGKFQSGVAFNYGEGDTNSMGSSAVTKSEYDFWGIGYYGNIRNEDTNVIFDVNYAKTDSDVTNKTFAGDYEASPETTTWTAGVKVEKLYQNNNVQIIPYTGLRYMSIDSDDYTTKCGTFSYKMDRQDIWLLPLGVSIRQEVVNNNGWVVTPKVDLSYIWAFGDTDSTMEFATALNTKTPIGYDVMDEGSWLGLVGVEATMDDWTFGVSYSYQKGDHSESKKWYVDAKYSF